MFQGGVGPHGYNTFEVEEWLEKYFSQNKRILESFLCFTKYDNITESVYYISAMFDVNSKP